VIEKLFAGQPKEMTTIYHLDGGQLVLAHYCSLGNQPHMVAVPGRQDELTAHWAATRDQKPASQSLFRVQRK